MQKTLRVVVCILGLAALTGLWATPGVAQEKEAAQGRPIRIRWTTVKRVNNLDQSFVIQRPTGRDGEKSTNTDTVIVIGKTTQIVIPPREGQPAPPAGTFANLVVGARVTISGTLTPDGKVMAAQVMVSAPRNGPEGQPAAEKAKP